MKHKQLLLAGLISSIALTLQSAPGLAVSLYSIDKEGNKLVTIDSSTGNVSIVGEVGFDVADVDLMLLNNKLYGTSGVFNGRWALYEFNTTTGAASLIANLSNDISLAEGLTTQNGKLIVGFINGTNRTGYKESRIGYVSSNGVNANLTGAARTGYKESRNGSLIQEVTLNRSGIYAGLAPVWATSVPEPSSTLGGGLVAVALSIIQIIHRSAIHAKQIVLP